MKPLLQHALACMKQYNGGDLAGALFGLDSNAVYDALVVAPGWKPTKMLLAPGFTVTPLSEHSYISGYLVEKNGLKIAWVQCASGACNLIDHLSVCGDLQFKKLFFVGAVGSLVPELKVGDLCTPEYSLAATFAGAYLRRELTAPYPLFEKVAPPDPDYVARVTALAARCGHTLQQAPVFCTDSIAMEYMHLHTIKATGAKLIEMETSAFYQIADLLEVPAIALLAVSDNSATGDPLVGGMRHDTEQYHHCRGVVIPELIVRITQEL